MANARVFFISLLLSVAPATLLAAPRPLCSAEEETIFSCRTQHKSYALCASKDLSATSGYMQYRAGPNGKSEFIFPDQRVTPLGHFKLSLLPRGAKLAFKHGDFSYEIVEPLSGKTTIWVFQGDRGPTLAAECLNFTDALTMTSTIDRFERLGIYEAPQ